MGQAAHGRPIEIDERRELLVILEIAEAAGRPILSRRRPPGRAQIQVVYEGRKNSSPICRLSTESQYGKLPPVDRTPGNPLIPAPTVRCSPIV
jgi:hypothetical protein